MNTFIKTLTRSPQTVTHLEAYNILYNLSHHFIFKVNLKDNIYIKIYTIFFKLTISQLII